MPRRILTYTERELGFYLRNMLRYAGYEAEFLYVEEIDVGKFSDMAYGGWDEILLALRWNKRLETVVSALRGRGISSILIVRLYAMDRLPRVFDISLSSCAHRIILDKPFLAHIETHLIDYCNLNCKSCNNFSPFGQIGGVKSDDSTDDMRYIAEIFNVERLFLLGGEPLIKADLCINYIEKARYFFPDTEIRLLTNGLLIGRMPTSFWEILRKFDIIVQITMYPPTMERWGEIRELLENVHVKYVSSENVTHFFRHWTTEPSENAAYNNAVCGSSGCHFFRDGRLYKCPDDVFAREVLFRGEAAEESPDGIELKDQIGVNIAEDVVEKLGSPIELCRYCTMQRGEWIPWEVCKGSPDVQDWLVEHRTVYEKRMFKELQEHFKQKWGILDEYVFIIWGKGNYFERNFMKIKGIIPFSYIVDRNDCYWGKEFEGLHCISPGELRTLSKVFCVICVEAPVALMEITEILQNMNIVGYEHMDSVLEVCRKIDMTM